MDKTCGTCRHALQTVVCCERPSMAGLHLAIDSACGRYDARADSVELVARDLLRALAHAAALIDVERWREASYRKEDALRERLEALGVGA